MSLASGCIESWHVMHNDKKLNWAKQWGKGTFRVNGGFIKKINILGNFYAPVGENEEEYEC
jgi:hypothetical protein